MDLQTQLGPLHFKTAPFILFIYKKVLMNLVLNMEISFGSKFIMPLRVAWKGADQGNLTFLSPRQNLLRMLGWAIWGGAACKHQALQAILYNIFWNWRGESTNWCRGTNAIFTARTAKELIEVSKSNTQPIKITAISQNITFERGADFTFRFVMPNIMKYKTWEFCIFLNCLQDFVWSLKH